jgi:hypothetical protein
MKLLLVLASLIVSVCSIVGPSLLLVRELIRASKDIPRPSIPVTQVPVFIKRPEVQRFKKAMAKCLFLCAIGWFVGFLAFAFAYYRWRLLQSNQ